MAAVTTFGPLLDRVYEALTSDTSKSRKLASGSRFVRGFPAAPAILSERAMLCREALSLSTQCLGSVFVDIAEQESLEGDPEMGSAHVIPISVVLSCDYYFGWFATNREARSTGLSEVAAAQVRMHDHFPKILAALCYPNAHNTTISGTDTGLCGGAFIRGGARRSAPVWNLLDGGSGRLANVTIALRGMVEWNPGS